MVIKKFPQVILIGSRLEDNWSVGKENRGWGRSPGPAPWWEQKEPERGKKGRSTGLGEMPSQER